jgi:hypothetical protein
MRIRRIVAAVITLVPFLAAGCGENSPPPGAKLGDPSPVRGKVTLPGGTQLRGGVVTFHAVEREVGGKLRYDGGALVEASGEYKAGFNGDGKGLVPGEYVVTVAPREVGELPGNNTAQIPKVYQDKSTSTIRVTVTEGDNTLNIAMK